MAFGAEHQCFSSYCSLKYCFMKVKGHFLAKLCVWPINLNEKDLRKYLNWFLSIWILEFSLWYQRSNLTSEVKGHETKCVENQPTTLHVKFGVDILNSSWIIEIWNLRFGLGDQIWPRRSKIIKHNEWGIDQ